MSSNDRKRKANDNHGQRRSGGKRSKKQFYNAGRPSLTGIESNAQGIFATCDKGKEARCVEELYAVLEEAAEKLYGIQSNEQDTGTTEDEDREEDIEASIANELAGMKSKKAKDERLFQSVKLDPPCIVFFHTKSPIVPTEVVDYICEDALISGKKRTRYTARLTPIIRTAKADYESLAEIAKEVLQPHFHEGQENISFAIRPSIRNHAIMTRDGIIQTIAPIVGKKHKVNLKEFELLILVEVLINRCGISVVRNFERFKRFNLVQIHESTLKAACNDADRTEQGSTDVNGPSGNKSTTQLHMGEEIGQAEIQTTTQPPEDIELKASAANGPTTTTEATVSHVEEVETI